jgi:hypothetical protein
MTEFERDWKEPETYSDFYKGCRLDVILILVFVLAGMVGIYYAVQ